jgi:hypothetical protein
VFLAQFAAQFCWLPVHQSRLNRFRFNAQPQRRANREHRILRHPIRDTTQGKRPQQARAIGQRDPGRFRALRELKRNFVVSLFR